MIGHRKYRASMYMDFYRDHFRKFMRWLIAAMCIIFFLIGFIVYLLLVQPRQLYFANTTDGRILTMVQHDTGS